LQRRSGLSAVPVCRRNPERFDDADSLLRQSAQWTYTNSGGKNPCDDGYANWPAGKMRLKINSPASTTTKVVSTEVPGYNNIRQNNASSTAWTTVSPFTVYSAASSFSEGYSVATSASLAVSAKFGLPLGLAEQTVTVTLSETQTLSETTTKTRTENYPSPAGLQLPPGGYVIYRLVEGYDKKVRTWTVPLELKGSVGADYGAGKWNGHYYWAINATAMWPEYAAGTEKGTIQKVQYLNHSIWVRAKVYYSNGTLYKTIGNVQ
jgi:hypothetical protein